MQYAPKSVGAIYKWACCAFQTNFQMQIVVKYSGINELLLTIPIA